MALVTFTQEDNGIGLITLNNPDSLNAMDEAMAEEFKALIDSIDVETSGLKVLILTGAGRAFSAGGNLQMLKDKSKLSKEENKARMLKFYDAFLCIRSLGVPLIAAVNGHAIGAGLCVACACDLRVAADGAKLGLTFTRLGLHPGMGATYFVPEILGSAQAREFLLTARIVKAEEAIHFGLVNRVVDAAEVVAEARKIAQEITACGPLSVRQLLTSLRGNDAELQSALEREADCQAENYVSAEFMEGVTAMIEKRKASF
jgi:enoyl-CoA hydratase